MSVVKYAKVITETDETVILEVQKSDSPRLYRLDDDIMRIAFVAEAPGSLVLYEPYPVEVD